jgi:hypothetical protein
MTSGVTDIYRLNISEASSYAKQELSQALNVSPDSINWVSLNKEFETICGDEYKNFTIFAYRFFDTIIRFSGSFQNKSPDNLRESYRAFLDHGNQCPEGTIGKARADVRKQYSEWASQLGGKIFYLMGLGTSENLSDLQGIRTQVDKVIGALEKGFFEREALNALGQVVGKIDDRVENDKKLAKKLLGLIGWSEKDGHPIGQNYFAKTVDEEMGHRTWKKINSGSTSGVVSSELQESPALVPVPDPTPILTPAPAQEATPPSPPMLTEARIAEIIGSLQLYVPDEIQFALGSPGDDQGPVSVSVEPSDEDPKIATAIPTVRLGRPVDEHQDPILESISKLDKNPNAERIILGLLNMMTLEAGQSSFPPHFEELVDEAQNFDPALWKKELNRLYDQSYINVYGPVDVDLENLFESLMIASGTTLQNKNRLHLLFHAYAYRYDRPRTWGDIPDAVGSVMTSLSVLRTMSLLVMLHEGKDHFVRDVLYAVDNEIVPIGILDLLIHATASQELSDERMSYAEFVLSELHDPQSAKYHLAYYIKPLLELYEDEMIRLAIETGQSMDTYFQDYYRRKLDPKRHTPDGSSSPAGAPPPQSTPTPTPAPANGGANTSASAGKIEVIDFDHLDDGPGNDHKVDGRAVASRMLQSSRLFMKAKAKSSPASPARLTQLYNPIWTGSAPVKGLQVFK